MRRPARKPHRHAAEITTHQRREAARKAIVERELGGKVICNECGARLADYGVKCSAALDRRCPGFDAVEAAMAIARAET